MELLEIPLVTLSACVVGHGLDIGHTPSVESVPKKSLLAIPRSAEESVSASPDGLNATALRPGNPLLTPAQEDELVIKTSRSFA